jgi:LuxR family transcriptional regulator, maltose regulon positive regulatory protein
METRQMVDDSPAALARDAQAAREARAQSIHITPPRFDFRPVATRALATLLHVPALPKLVAVSAAPGYGKTVLLSRLHEELAARGTRCLWLTLDDRDSDVSTLLFRLRAAMAEAQRAASPEAGVRPASAPSFGGSSVFIVDEVLMQLAQFPGETVLFIDNLGFCHDRLLPELLARLVFSSGPDLRLVLSSTRDMPIDIVRAKLEKGAIELGGPQLSFDRKSTMRLFEEAGVAGIGEEALSRIQSQTEGWPTAVRLLQVLMTTEQRLGGTGAEPDAASVLDRFSGDHRDIARMLTRKVLVGFDPDLVQFMLEIALVREFSVELALRMTGRSEAKMWIDTLVSRNVLIFPLDQTGRWLRFHTLLRDFLLAEGHVRVDIARRNEVLGNAARWHADQGDDVTALGAALDAHAIPLAESLLEGVGSVVAGEQGRMVPYIQWTDQLLAIGGSLSVEAHGWYVWALCNAMQYERARKALDSFDARAADGAQPGEAGRVAHARRGFLRTVINVYLDRLEEAHAGALATVADDEPQDALSLAVSAGIAAIVEIDRSELGAARDHMELAEAAMYRADSPWGSAWVGILWAVLEMTEARPAVAEQKLQEVRAKVAAALGSDAQVVATIDFVLARVVLDLGRDEQSREFAQRGLPRAMHHGIVTSAEQGFGACAALWTGEDDDVLSPQAIEKVAHSYPARLHKVLAASRIRRCLQLGRIADAQMLAQRLRIGATAAESTIFVPRDRGDWMLAPIEMKIAVGHYGDAMALVERQLRLAQSQGRQRDAVELLLAAAEIQVREQNPAQALRHLSLAISAAAPGKLMHPFQCRRFWLGPLFATIATKDFGLVQPAELALLERLRLDLGEAEVATPGLDAPSVREIQLLELLDQGLSNQQVADRLSLSLTTVKWHLRNVYAKLEVGSRSGALAKARALHLLVRR